MYFKVLQIDGVVVDILCVCLLVPRCVQHLLSSKLSGIKWSVFVENMAHCSENPRHDLLQLAGFVKTNESNLTKNKQSNSSKTRVHYCIMRQTSQSADCLKCD